MSSIDKNANEPGSKNNALDLTLNDDEDDHVDIMQSENHVDSRMLMTEQKNAREPQSKYDAFDLTSSDIEDDPEDIIRSENPVGSRVHMTGRYNLRKRRAHKPQDKDVVVNISAVITPRKKRAGPKVEEQITNGYSSAEECSRFSGTEAHDTAISRYELQGSSSDEESLFGSSSEVNMDMSLKHQKESESREVQLPKPIKAVTLVSPESYPDIMRQNKDDSYLSLKWGKCVVINETHYSEGPPDSELGKDNKKYEIFNSKLKEQHSIYNEDGMGKKYIRSCYRLMTKGVNLAYELSRIADFESLTYESGPQKTASRIDLLASKACHLPGRKINCLHELEADLFEIIKDNGHLGCGLIPLQFLQEDILQGSAAARRAFAIQVRIIGPSDIGVAKGMLVAAQGIDKILLPESMIKVGPSRLSKEHMLHTNVILTVTQVFPYNPHTTMQRLLNPDHPNNHTFRKAPSPKQIVALKGLPGMTKTVLHTKDCTQSILKEYDDLGRLDHASLIGVTDPTGCIPEGHVCLTGFGDEIPMKVFVSVFPATEPNDGIIIPVANSMLPAHAKLFLESLSFGAIVFAQGPNDTLIPPTLDDADLDGDLYAVVWNNDILKTLQDRATSDIEELSDDEDLVGTRFQTKFNGPLLRPATVVGMVEHQVYLVKTDKTPAKYKDMTKEEIYGETLILDEVIGHRLRPTQFLFKWKGGRNEWVTMKDAKSMYLTDPPLQLLVYAEEKGLVGDNGPKDCKWLTMNLPSVELAKIEDHRELKSGKYEVLCVYEGGFEEWEPLQDVVKDGKLQVAQYAREKSLFEEKGWTEARDYWLNVIQEMFSTGRSTDISGLMKALYRKYEDCYLSEEFGPKHRDTIAWGRAYKQANRIQKHGGRIVLPLLYHLQIPKKWQSYVELA